MTNSHKYFTRFLKALAIALLVVSSTLVVSTADATAGINRTVNFQGKLVNKTTGVNVADGSYTFVFAIYNQSSGGSKLWGDETQNSVSVNDGIFRVALGSVRTFASDNLDFNQDNLWLDVTFNGENFGSRVRLASVPSAITAESVAGLTVTNNGGNTLNIAANKTFTVSNSLTLSGADSKTINFGANSLTFTTAADASLTLPTSGTVCTTASCLTADPFWGHNLGALYPLNSTEDLIIGGQSSTSAVFAVKNLSDPNHQTVASVSGNLIVNPNNGFGGLLGIQISSPSNLIQVKDLIDFSSSSSATMLGYRAGYANSGVGSTFIGYEAGFRNTSSVGNTAVGYQALRASNQGGANTAFGYQSLKANTSGNNSAFGYQSLLANTSGQFNDAFGDSSLVANISGARNTAIGYNALNANTIGDDNVSVGEVSLRLVTSGTRNVGIGRNVGQTLKVGGSNTLLGYLADVQAAHLINATALGANSYVAGNDSLVLGSIGGTNSATGSAKIGIGTTTPTSALYVTRPINSSSVALGQALAVFDQIENQDILAASKSGTAKFKIDSSGNLFVAGGAAFDTGSGLGIASGALSIGNTNATGLTIGGNQLTSGITFNVDTAANYTFQKEGSAFSCSGTDKLTLTTGVLTCSADVSGGGGTNWWTTSSDEKALTPINSTMDLLIGGQATTSAVFAVNGLADSINHQTTATLSGNLIIFPNNGFGGLLGVGVTSPTNLIQVKDLIDFSSSSSATMLGYRAGFANSAVGSVFVGYETGFLNTTGLNTAVGYKALRANTTGSQNSAFGYNALLKSDSTFNSAFGYNALLNNTTGSGNSAFGAQALQANTFGGLNSGFGYQSLTSTTQGVRNAAFGYQAGFTNTVGGLNVFLGYNADVTNGKGNLINAGAIGSNAEVSVNDALILGSIGGTNSATGSAKIGIGITAPTSAFYVTRPINSNSTALGQALAIFDQIENQDIFTASKSGIPEFKVDGSGNLFVAGGAILDTGSGAGVATGFGVASGVLGVATTNATGLTLGGNQLTSGITFNIDTAANYTLQKEGSAFSCSGTDKLTLDGSGHLICSSDSTGSGTNYFNQASGLTYIGNTTTDFAIGGTASSSAEYVFGVNSASPMATFAADLIIDARPNSAATDIMKWTKFTGTSGTVGGGSTTSIASVSAAAVFNGSLYVGTNKANAAEVYRYDGPGPGTWTLVSGTGSFGSSPPTTSVDMVSSMVVYNGYLYIGTQEGNKAEVYRYDGSTNWTRVNSAAGTLQTTTLIDGVSSLAVFGGELYAGTRESAKAELYRYNGGTSWTAINTTAGTFVTTNTASVNAVNTMVVYNNQLILGLEKVGDSDVVRWNGNVGASVFTALNNAGTTGSYLIDNAATTGYNGVTAIVIWGGRLVVALQKANAADVLMFNGLVGVGTDSWQRLNSAAGTIDSGGTANIDGVSSMAVYNGRLYIGTLETDSAEIYRFETGVDWTRVSQGVAGTVGSGVGQDSLLDQISVLISYNHNSLFAGTMNSNISAAGYSYVNITDQSYALKFNAGTSQAGGEQNNLQNMASIFFVASLSANVNNKAGNTGTFVFSHGIMTSHGSYDVAEDYPTRDDSLEPGDLVSIDTNERGFVVKSSGAYDPSTVGVYSENPGLRLSQNDDLIDGGRAVPIALVGRVPIKVTAKNGAIKSGDYLTASDIPGVAMKATKNGLVIGQAMASYDGEGVGKILGYIKSTSYAGSIADNYTHLDTSSQTFSQDILNELLAKKSEGSSNIVTDRLIAGLEIITPKITADEITVRKIKAGQIEGLDLLSSKIESLDQKVASIGAATSSSTQDKQTELMNNIMKELQAATASAKTAENVLNIASINVDGIASISGSLKVRQNGLIEGILTVLDTITTNNFIASGVSNFLGETIFKDKVTFSNDIGGIALIKKSADRVEVKFDTPFEDMPVVNASVSYDENLDQNDKQKPTDELEQAFFDQGYSYLIVNKSKKGFVIVLNKKAKDNVSFTWTALRVRDQKTFQSRVPN